MVPLSPSADRQGDPRQVNYPREKLGGSSGRVRRGGTVLEVACHRGAETVAIAHNQYRPVSTKAKAKEKKPIGLFRRRGGRGAREIALPLLTKIRINGRWALQKCQTESNSHRLIEKGCGKGVSEANPIIIDGTHDRSRMGKRDRWAMRAWGVNGRRIPSRRKKRGGQSRETKQTK